MGSLGTDRGSGGFEKLKAGAERSSEGSYAMPFKPGPPFDDCRSVHIRCHVVDAEVSKFGSRRIPMSVGSTT